jgi:hypothetical protein
MRMQMLNLNLNLVLVASGLLLFCCLHPVFSQVGEGLKPRKVDTYNDQIRGGEAERSQLLEFLEELAKEPTAKAYIIAYGGRKDKPGKALRYALRAKNYLVESRGVHPAQIVAIDGGRREDFVVELWIVPNGAKPPEPAPTITVKDDPGDNLLYDSFEVDCEGYWCAFENDAAHLDGFAAALKKEPGSWACIIAYAQSGDDRAGQEWDPPGRAKEIAESQKKYLIKRHGLAPSRLSAVDGGYSARIVELWIMRPGARFDYGPRVYSYRLKSNRNGTLTITQPDDPLEFCCTACTRPKTGAKVLRNGEPVKP